MNNTLAIALCLLLSFTSAGCATSNNISPDTFKHILSVDKDGGVSKNVSRIKSNIFDLNGLPNEENQIDQIIAGLQEYDNLNEGPANVVIYIHGGLNSEATALARVEEKHKLIDNAYPIFVNWNTDFGNTYFNHLYRIRQGEVSRNLALVTSPVYFLTDIGNTAINAPKSWGVSGFQSLQSGTLRRASSINESLEKVSAENDFIGFTGNGKPKNGYLSRGVWIATGIPKLITTPFVYTLAKPAWDVMLRRSNTMFYRYNKPELNQSADGENQIGSFGLLLKALEKYNQKNDSILNISLIGHSMGAIVANKALAYAPDLKIANIVHMGSADSVESIFTKVIPYLEDHTNSKFYSLHLHPGNEDRERNYAGFIPSGSLLVWIDEMYSSPDSILARRAGRWDNVAGVLDRFPASPAIMKRVHFKIYGLDRKGSERDDEGLLKIPQKHGDFSHLEFWNEQTWE